MINFENMDLVWSVIGSKRGDEKPTEQELSQFSPELANIIKIAFQTQDWKTKEYRYLFDTYWQLEYQRRIDNYVKKESESKRPQNVVIGEIYYSNYGEPHKKGDKITWISLFGQYSGTIKDFKMGLDSVSSHEAYVILTVIPKNEEEVTLKHANSFSIQGKKHKKYFNNYLKEPCREFLGTHLERKKSLT